METSRLFFPYRDMDGIVKKDSAPVKLYSNRTNYVTEDQYEMLMVHPYFNNGFSIKIKEG